MDEFVTNPTETTKFRFTLKDKHLYHHSTFSNQNANYPSNWDKIM